MKQNMRLRYSIQTDRPAVLVGFSETKLHDLAKQKRVVGCLDVLIEYDAKLQKRIIFDAAQTMVGLETVVEIEGRLMVEIVVEIVVEKLL